MYGHADTQAHTRSCGLRHARMNNTDGGDDKLINTAHDVTC